MSCCTRIGSLNLHMKRTSIFIIIIKRGCILGSSQKLMKIWSNGGGLIIIGFIYLFLLWNTKEQVYTVTTWPKTWAIFGFTKGISSALTPNNVKKLLNQQVCLVELTKGGQAPTPFLGRTIKLAKYSCAISFVNTTTNNNVTN